MNPGDTGVRIRGSCEYYSNQLLLLNTGQQQMKSFSRVLKLIVGVDTVVAALLILIVITPQQKLCLMLNATPVFLEEKAVVLINFPFVAHRVSMPVYFVHGLLMLFLLALLPLSSNVRNVITAIAKQKNFAVAGLLSLGVFLFTVTPRPPAIGGESGWYATIYLLGSSFGLCLLFLGGWPLLKELSKRQFFRKRMIGAWERLRHLFMDTRQTWFLGILFCVFFALTNLASYFLFAHIPHTMDSIAQVFHGKIFAEGMLAAPSPAHREFFDLINSRDQTTMINNGKWYSQFPPGHSFLLMLGILIDAPWIINPLLGSLTVVLFYFLGVELYGERIGRLSALLGALSPFIFFMSSEFMNHASALFFFTVFLLFFAKTVRAGKIAHAIIAGAALGMMLNIRPLTAFALAIPFCGYGAFLLVRRFRESWAPLLAIVLTVLLFASILFGFNALTNGDPFLFGYEVLYGSKHNPGFGNGPWGEPHTPLQGLHQTLNDLNGLNKFLFEWPAPSLIFVVLLFASMTKNKWDFLLLAAFLSLTAAYFFYWFQEWRFGPRFLYESSAALILLTARGIQRLPELIRECGGLAVSVRKVRAATLAFIAVCVLIGVAGNIPALIHQYGNDFGSVNAEVLKAVEERRIKNAIVFVRSNYGSVFTANSPSLNNGIIYARDLFEKNYLLMNEFPSYVFYLADGGDIRVLARDEAHSW
jgi:hypothetical protein